MKEEFDFRKVEDILEIATMNGLEGSIEKWRTLIKIAQVEDSREAHERDRWEVEDLLDAAMQKCGLCYEYMREYEYADDDEMYINCEKCPLFIHLGYVRCFETEPLSTLSDAMDYKTPDMPTYNEFENLATEMLRILSELKE